MLSLDLRLLKALVDHQRLALEFSVNYSSKFFADPLAKEICGIFINYIKLYKSSPTKRVLLEEYEEDEEVQALVIRFFDLVENFTYDEQDYNFDVQKLKERYSNFLIKKAHDSLEEDTDYAEKLKSLELSLAEIKSINKEKVYTKKTLKEHVPDFKREYATKLKNPDYGRGILTGYSFLDFIKNGLKKDEFLLICGETGTGKSMFLNNLAVQTWLQGNTPDSPNYGKGCNVTYFSLEMSYEDCFRRTLARIADVPTYALRDARLYKPQAERVSRVLKFINNYGNEFDIVDVPRGFSVEELELYFHEAKTKYNPDVIFIDYLGLMAGIENEEEDWLKLGMLAGRVHEFARAYQVPVCSAVQLNRLDSKRAKPVGLHRIGRSSLIAHHSSLIIQIETREHEEAIPDLVYHVIKNRDGELGHARLNKNFANASITDIPYDAAKYMIGGDVGTDDISEDLANIIGNIISDAENAA